MAPCNAKTKLESARDIIINQEPTPGKVLAKPDIPKVSKTWQQMMEDLTGINLTLCPRCGKGRLVRFKLTDASAFTIAPNMGFIMICFPLTSNPKPITP